MEWFIKTRWIRNDQQIEFETDNNGNPFKVWHIAWGVKKELKKME
jgi:hypothetical protein